MGHLSSGNSSATVLMTTRTGISPGKKVLLAALLSLLRFQWHLPNLVKDAASMGPILADCWAKHPGFAHYLSGECGVEP